MKQKLILILLTLTMQIFSNIVAIECKNVVKGGDTVTVEVIATGSPDNLIELDHALEDIAHQIRFKEEGYDRIMFWLNIIKLREKIATKPYNEQFKIIIYVMNKWLDNIYGNLK